MPRVTRQIDTKVRHAATFVVEREDHTVGNIVRMCVAYQVSYDTLPGGPLEQSCFPVGSSPSLQNRSPCVQAAAPQLRGSVRWLQGPAPAGVPLADQGGSHAQTRLDRKNQIIFELTLDQMLEWSEQIFWALSCHTDALLCPGANKGWQSRTSHSPHRCSQRA